MNAIAELNLSTAIVVTVWTAIIGGGYYYDTYLGREHIEELALNEARASFNTNKALRLWVVRHGGVYVPIDKDTPPNPAMAHIPERDIETPSGKKLTLMNSAYVLRQLMGSFGELHGIKGKLTSLKPLNPDNTPDLWETNALRQFESGQTEIHAFTKFDGIPYLRLMSALLVEDGCLKCHGTQGYKIGDVRGGASIAVPMEPYIQDAKATARRKSFIYSMLWIVGLAGIVTWSLVSRRRLLEKAEIDARLLSQHAAIERANTELTHFANISAHHLMEPTRRLLSYAQRLRNRLDHRLEDEDTRLSLAFIEQSATRLRDLIRDIERYLAASIVRGPLQLTEPSIALKEVQKRLSKLIADRHALIDVQAIPLVYLDLPRLTDIFEVLLVNALVHTNADQPVRIRISAETLSSAIRIRVDDNGPGVPAEYRDRVFGVFEQLRPNPLAGTGIGLAIARRIIESRNGKIWIETAALGGTAVVFELPTEMDKT
ncbi:MAG: c-type heme family protein [Gammaproteobacteria bacterium]